MRTKLTTTATAACLAALLIVPAAASAHGTHLKAKMTGEQVVGAPGAPNGEGTAKVHLLKGKEMLCFKVNWSGIGGTRGLNAGIYSGAAGQNGNEVVALNPDREKSNSIIGCVDTPKSDLRKLNRNPHLFHANLKTRNYPTYGAIRGNFTS